MTIINDYLDIVSTSVMIEFYHDKYKSRMNR